MNERERVAMLEALFASAAPGVRLAIGDDAAVLEVSGLLVASLDTAVEGVHFRRAWLSFEDLGYKATMAALSDLAAMAARPVGVLAALALPPDIDDGALEAIARGQRSACDRHGIAMVGGNLARAGELSITTTVLGSAARVLRRDGARPGDRLVVTGPLGLARAGLSSLLADDADPRLEPARQAWRRPSAHIDEGLALLARGASAAMDVSDGLALDLSRLSEASGVTIVVDAAALASPPLVAAAAALSADPVALAIEGGEDYVLLATLPENADASGLDVIGVCAEPVAGRPELFIERDGIRSPLAGGGFDHFASPQQ